MLSSNTDLNLEQIARDCGLFGDKAADAVIAEIDALEDKYSKNDLLAIYNYMLVNAKEPDVIMHIIRCLDRYRDSSSLEFLVDILLLRNAEFAQEEVREKYNNVRIMCAKAIANQKNTDVVSSLLYCLNNKNENYRVRLACADALGRIGDRFAVAPLIEVVNDEDEKSVYLRESAVSALGLLGDSRAVDPLVSILETKQGIMDKFSFLKERAIEALIKVGFLDNERVFRALKNSLSDESTQVRINAIEALMDSEHPKAYDTIKHVLENDTDFEVRKNAMIALYNMSDRGILDEVIASADYPDNLKVEAVSIIDEYEDSEEEDIDD
ncbi:MAG: HEAT repeat domain-containing protein [Muribaculaceae bacterium]|nr:HEAT repeat domain-containing protein [Muribaculaceae bacterium]